MVWLEEFRLSVRGIGGGGGGQSTTKVGAVFSGASKTATVARSDNLARGQGSWEFEPYIKGSHFKALSGTALPQQAR
jgi:hypothetical protein